MVERKDYLENIGVTSVVWMVSHLALYPPGESLILSNLARPDYLVITVITGQTVI